TGTPGHWRSVSGRFFEDTPWVLPLPTLNYPKLRQMTAMSEDVGMIPDFWFERLNNRFSLPTWAGALVFGVGGFLIPAIIPSAVLGQTYAVGLSQGLAMSLAVSLFTFYTGRYLRKEISGLVQYARKMEEPPVTGDPLDVSKLTSLRWILVTYVCVAA